jgi:hypothetical protein
MDSNVYIQYIYSYIIQQKELQEKNMTYKLL